MVGFALLNPPYVSVMPGLVPGISIQSARRCHWERDGRDKPGHDAGEKLRRANNPRLRHCEERSDEAIQR
jgi:hypothetical protein